MTAILVMPLASATPRHFTYPKPSVPLGKTRSYS